jgi:phage-related protein
MKDLEFIGSSKEDLRSFPEDARRDAGFQLHFVQAGQEPGDWKPMTSIGPGVIELRIHKQGEWRIIYVAKFQNRVSVLHAFQKKTQKTRKADIELAQERYREVERREKAKQKAKQ